MTTPSSHSQSICVRPAGNRIDSPAAITADGSFVNRYGFHRVSAAWRSQMPGALLVPGSAAPGPAGEVSAPPISAACSR